MSKLFEYLKNYDNVEESEKSPICISLGLGISLALLEEIFEEAHRRKIDPNKTHLTVSSILGTTQDACSGLYISNELTLRGARLTRNGLAGCGRVYLGNSKTIPYPERIPKEGLVDPRDYEFKDIPNMAKTILNHITRD